MLPGLPGKGGKSMNTTAQRTRFVFTLLQVLTVMAALLVAAAAYVLIRVGIVWHFNAYAELFHSSSPFLWVAAVIGTAGIVIGAACSFLALASFFRMCGRLKGARAFTQANARALKLIQRTNLLCAIACVLTPMLMDVFFRISLGKNGPVLASSLTWIGGFRWLMLIGFLYFGVSMAAKALHALLLHAMALQEENDWTV